MNCRKDVKDLSPTEKSDFVQALIDLKRAPSLIAAAQAAGAQGRYDDYVWIHEQVRAAAHDAPAFVPWHREFLYQIERDLQTVSGNPRLTIPYWDWTRARSAADPGWPFTADLLGGLGASATDSRVTTGRFATDPTDPTATEWRINVADAETGNYLKRRGAPEEFELPLLSWAQTAMGISVFDVAPFVIPDDISDEDFNTAVFASFRKFLEFALHNGPHPWVGTQGQFHPITGAITNADVVGSMTWQASPNDPAFWLHHCNIDRLWAIWQQRYDYPGYVPQTGGGSMQNGPNTMGMYNQPSYFSFPQHPTPNSNQFHRPQGYLYWSDLPEVADPVGSLSFGDVPNGLETYKPVQFTVTSCRPIQFEITALAGAGVSNPYPGAHSIVPPDEGEPFIADVYVSFEAPATGTGSASGSVTIEAFIEDPDRLYVAPAAATPRVTLRTWTISLSANVVERPRAAIALALDRSGSMSAQAGGGLTRFGLLEDAVDVVSDIMRAEDGLGLVYYDHNVDRRMEITAMTASGGKSQVSAAIADPALEPSGGSTAIGSGMIQAADVLRDEMTRAGTPYTRFAMLVMTDGNENVSPFSTSAPVASAIGSFSNDVYAVGLGREGEVSDGTLGAIANYMLITGDMDATEREFRMQKYFVQILASVTNMSIVVDPPGELMLGHDHRIEFDLTAADVEAEVIALSPLAFLIDMKLEAPDGTVVTPAGTGPNGSFHRNLKDVFYRLRLPAFPSRADGTHGGRWKATLTIARDRVKELAHHLEKLPELRERLSKGVVPFALHVQTYSSLSLDVAVEQDKLTTGATLLLHATLRQYQAPLSNRGAVRAEIVDPSGALVTRALTETGPGKFEAQFGTSVPGIYHVRFLASGRTLENEPFTREATRTAAVYRRPPTTTPTDDRVDPAGRSVCKVIECLLEDDGIRAWLERSKIDGRRLYECVAALCESKVRAVTEGASPMKTRKDDTADELDARHLARLVAPLLRDTGPLGILEAPAPKRVKRDEPQTIGMNPLRGMWPMVETKDGKFRVLLKDDKGRSFPDEEKWKAAPEDPPRRVPKLPDGLVKRIQSRGRTKK